jgi:hypothetical protein
MMAFLANSPYPVWAPGKMAYMAAENSLLVFFQKGHKTDYQTYQL